MFLAVASLGGEKRQPEIRLRSQPTYCKAFASFSMNNSLHSKRNIGKSKAPVSQLVNVEVNSVVVIAVLAPNYTLQVRICECHA